jgi:pyruvate,water dikinase
VALIGGKALGLCWLQESGYRIPDTWVLSTAAFDAMITSAGLGDHVAELEQVTAHRPDWRSVEVALQALEDRRRDLIAALRTSPLPEAVRAALGKLARQAPYWAVRSSATVEDGARHSFAGQFQSFLSVPAGDPLIEAVRAVWASTFDKNALHYRAQHGTALPRMAVILQPMLPISERDRTGVAFSQSPLPDHPGVLLQGAFGAGLAVVGAGEGEVKCVDGMQVTTLSRFSTHILVSGRAGGMRPVPKRLGQVLNDAEAVYLAGQVREIAARYGRPADIEFIWPVADPPTFLQVRPISSAAVGRA